MILFGFQHCGKTYFGQKLAQKLQLPFLDTDHLIEKKVGYSYRTLWQEDPKLFRKIEKEVIFSLFPGPVIALGGGAILDQENQDHLAKLAPLIYLKMSFEHLQKRYRDPISFEKLYQERLPQYESICAKTLHLDEKSDEEVLWQAMH